MEIHAHRAPGFDNKKKKHQKADGSFPEVRLIEAKGGICGKTLELAKKIKNELELASTGRQKQLDGIASAPENANTLAAYKTHAKDVIRLQKLKGNAVIDASRVDYMACMRLRATGHSAEAIEEVLLNAAPEIRKLLGSVGVHDWHDYAKRTADYVFSDKADRDIDKNRKYIEHWRIMEKQRKAANMKGDEKMSMEAKEKCETEKTEYDIIEEMEITSETEDTETTTETHKKAKAAKPLTKKEATEKKQSWAQSAKTADQSSVIREDSEDQRLPETQQTKVTADERREESGGSVVGAAVSAADINSAKFVAQTIIDNEDLMKGSMVNEGHEQAALDTARASKSFLNSVKTENTYPAELSRLRKKAGPGVQIKEAEVKKYYGPGRLEIYEKTAILTLKDNVKIAYNIKDLRGKYPPGTELNVRLMRHNGGDRGFYLELAREKEENQR